MPWKGFKLSAQGNALGRYSPAKMRPVRPISLSVLHLLTFVSMLFDKWNKPFRRVETSCYTHGTNRFGTWNRSSRRTDWGESVQVLGKKVKVLGSKGSKTHPKRRKFRYKLHKFRYKNAQSWEMLNIWQKMLTVISRFFRNFAPAQRQKKRRSE